MTDVALFANIVTPELSPSRPWTHPCRISGPGTTTLVLTLKGLFSYCNLQCASLVAFVKREHVTRLFGGVKGVVEGLYYSPIESRFGPVPATEHERLRAFLNGPFIISGPRRWNALGLDSTALFAVTLVYNTKRTGEFVFDNRRYLLRRVRFPENPPEEWFVIDLLQHHEQAGIPIKDLAHSLTSRLRGKALNAALLSSMAEEYGTKATQALVAQCIDGAKIAL